jgi:hypothetical protein
LLAFELAGKNKIQNNNIYNFSSAGRPFSMALTDLESDMIFSHIFLNIISCRVCQAASCHDQQAGASPAARPDI